MKKLLLITCFLGSLSLPFIHGGKGKDNYQPKKESSILVHTIGKEQQSNPNDPFKDTFQRLEEALHDRDFLVRLIENTDKNAIIQKRIAQRNAEINAIENQIHTADTTAQAHDILETKLHRIIAEAKANDAATRLNQKLNTLSL